jgi:hypothetical protein
MKYLKTFENNNNNNKTLLYYAFDWDDNILHMPTVIHMERLIDNDWIPVDVSTAEFAEVRSDKDNWRIIENDPDKAFSEFRDFGYRGDKAFLFDIKKALREDRKGPVWNDFIECITHGALFSIITARGHEPNSIRKGIEYIIDDILTENEKYLMYNNLLRFAYIFRENKEFDRILKVDPSKSELVKIYLDNCEYIGVSAPSRGGAPDNPEKSKEEALLDFKLKINNFAQNIGYKAIIGFSDDDVKNVKHIENLIDSIHNEQFPHIIKYVVKGTKDKENITKKVKEVEFNENSHQAPGMASSIMPFTQFNNITNRLYPSGPYNRQDDIANKKNREADFLANMSNDILKEDKKKKKTKKK